MARPTKYDDKVVKKIEECLRAGTTRRAACLCAGISEDTLARWLQSYADFADSLARAEAECEVRNTAALEKAAFGFNQNRTIRTVKSIIKPRKMRFPNGGKVETTHPDGSVTATVYPKGSAIEEPVSLEEVSEQTIVSTEFDWHAALEWLKRRRRLDWGEKVEIDWKSLTSEQIIEILMRTVPPEFVPPVSSSAAGRAGKGGRGSTEAGTELAGPGG